ncbi:hypothetical protein GCM10023322_07260 [Rugosimonospora acidiphila]|uniref:Peptidase S53 domain-containing protein n=1 Tax=Rugosimonospora acidiphila TaxID=556531 RepID=A0ABP9RKY6_9ACTN
MLRTKLAKITVTAGLAVAVTVGGSPALAAGPAGSAATVTAVAELPDGVRAACAPSTAPGQMACTALVRTDLGAGTGVQPAAPPPPGFAPADLQAAYGLPSSYSGSRQTIAVVDAFDDPNAEADLAVYRSQFGLPACTVASGCLTRVDQNGGTTFPVPDPAWANETAIDLDMVSAACPNCRILLVEANSANISDLGSAVNTAVFLGARFVSNSYAGPEDSNNLLYDNTYFNHPGVAVTVAAGDSGYGVNYPAASQYVTAVGGTTLTRTGTGWRGWSESAYGLASAGCSAYDPKPAWQHDTGCANRSVADVATVADPATGVAYYNSFNAAGWLVGGGTSVGAPLVAAAYGLAGTPPSTGYPAAYPYAGAAILNDVTAGTDGTCSVTYLCNAGTGYDGPTGLGTPQGPMSFSSTGSITGPLPSGVYGKCLDDDGSTADGSPVTIWTCNGTANQGWTLSTDGTIRIGTACLTVSGTANNDPAHLYHCNHTVGQQWRVGPSGELINPNSGRCLDDPSATTTNGTQQVIYNCKGIVNQRWTLPSAVPASAAVRLVSGVPSNLCANDSGGKATDGNPIQIWTCNGTSAQTFSVKSDGTIRVAGVCVDVKASGKTPDTPVQAHSCNGTGAQQWLVRPDGTLLNPESGLCLTDPFAATLNGTQLVISTCSAAADQTWALS